MYKNMTDKEILKQLNSKYNYFKKIHFIYSDGERKYFIGQPINPNNNSIIFWFSGNEIKSVSATKDDEIRLKYKDILCNLK